MSIQLYKFKSIKTKLTFWFLFLTLLPLIGVLIINSLQRANSIEERTIDKLSTISELKVQQLNSWLGEINSDMLTLSTNVDIISIGKALNMSPKNEDSKNIIQKIKINLLSYLRNHTSYNELFLIDATNGLIITSTTNNSIGRDKSNDEYFTKPIKTKAMTIKDIFYSKTISDYSMTYSIPIYGKNTINPKIEAILVARIDLNNSLYKILLNRTGLGETGETLLVNNNVITLNQLRWYDNAPLNLKIKAEPAIRAASGKTGIIKANDYRGQEVLAAYTFIPQTNWGFVVKQDTNELQIPINKMIFSFLLVFIIVSIVISIMAITIANSIAKTIVGMNNVARSMRSGNYKIRNKVTANDELGSLAMEFNNMADMTESRILIQRGISNISKAMIGRTSMEDFSLSLLKEIKLISEANICVFYILNETESRFEPLISIGADKETLENFDSNTPEGDFGNAISQRSIYFLKNIQNESHFKYKTIVGNIMPEELLTIPIIVEDSVVALISISTINSFSIDFNDIINQSWDIINTSYSNFLSSERTRVFADHLSRINNQLEVKTVELEDQTFEVKKQSEKLHESSIELQSQNIELEKQRIEVEEANKLKSEFLSNMSHELRTPLNSIMALSSVLVSDSQDRLSKEEQNYLKIIERNGKRLLSLINDILDLSKIEAGKMDIIPEHFSLSYLINLVVENIQTLANQKGLIINTDIPDNIQTIESDEMRLHQVLLNIISNAVKFTSDGEINIFVKEIVNNTIISISDTGIGITDDALPYIFDEFRQVDGTSSRQYEGTGLGLAIANKIIIVLGGSITVNSKINIGTTFTITIPQQWKGPKKTRLKSSIVPVAKAEKQNKTILIVDDNPDIVERISSHLKSAGYNTHGVTKGEDAIEYARKHKPHAITLDIIMPEIDGWEVLQTLKKDTTTTNIPIIIVSVSAEKDTGIALGAIGHITKPIHQNRLLSEIEKADKLAKTVMIVDDNEPDMKIMADIIENNNISALRISSGKECLNVLKKFIPSVLVLDLFMPEVNGFEVLNNVRNNPITRHIPIIIVTAKDISTSEKLVLENNVEAIIQKSDTTSTDLFKEIEQLIIKLDNSKETFRLKDYETSEKPENTTILNSNKANILIIEDNPDNMATIKALLKNKYNFFEAIDGEEAIKTIEIVLPDLILLDMSLPKISGMKLLEIFKSNIRSKNIPIIAVTADAMIGDREIIIKAGCDEYVSKPINKNDLISKINMLLNQ